MYEFLKNILAVPTVTGHEAEGVRKIAALAMDFAWGFFDSCEILPSGSAVLVHRSTKETAGTLLLDAHIDTVGFAVSEYAGDGFVKVVPLGGIDPYILPAAPVYLTASDGSSLYGVFTSIPPHLAGKSDKKLKLEDLYVDTGLSDENCKRLVPIGTPVYFADAPKMLQNNIVASPYLDDKACVAAILSACKTLAESGEKVESNVVVHLAVGEEKTGLGGKTLPYAYENADACLVLDVNFGTADGIDVYRSIKIGQGGGVSYSAVTSKAFTDFVAETAEKAGLSVQKVVEMTSTGTNANHIHRGGIPCAVLSIPLRNMHTPVECVSLDDIESTAAVVARVIAAFQTAKSNFGEVIFK